MSNPMPGSPAAVSLTLGEERVPEPMEPLASIDELDDDTIASLVRSKHRYERIVQWSSMGPSFALTGWFTAEFLGLIPPGPIRLVVWALLGVSFVGSASYLFAQRRHWRRECAAVGLTAAQSKELFTRLLGTTGGRSLRTRYRASPEERVQWEVDGFAAGRHKRLDGATSVDGAAPPKPSR